MERIEKVAVFTEKKFIVTLIFGSLLIRILYVVFFNVNKVALGQDIMMVGDDQGSYWQFAQVFLTDTSWLTTYINHRPPVYPIFLAVVSAIVGPGKNFLSIFFVQSIINIVPIFIIYFLAKRIFNKETALLASLWAAIYPLYLYYCGFLLRETIIIFLFLLFTLLLIKYVEEKKGALVVFLGVLYALLIHADPRFLFHMPFLLLYFTIGLKSFKQSVKPYALFVFIVVLCSLPWAVRNYFTYKDTFVLIDTSTLDMWAQKALINVEGDKKKHQTHDKRESPDTVEKFEEIKRRAIMSLTAQRSSGISDTALYAHGIKNISSEEELRAFERGIRPTFDIFHLYVYHFLEFWRFARFYPDYDPYPDLRFEHVWSLQRNIIGIIFTGLLYPFFIAGVMLSLKQKNRYALILFLIMGVHTFQHVIVHARERYRMPIEGFIFIFAFYIVVTIISKYISCVKSRSLYKETL